MPENGRKLDLKSILTRIELIGALIARKVGISMQNENGNDSGRNEFKAK